MATLATLLDRAMGTPLEEPGTPAGPYIERDDPYAIRALPNEDICLWIKSFDNSRVARQLDPNVRSACWKFISMASLAVVLVVGLLLPNAYGLLASYQLGNLEKENRQLLSDRETLKLEQARMESPRNLEHWAAVHGLRHPSPNKVVYLRPADGGSLALNLNKR